MASSPDSISMALFCDFENVALGVRDANYEKFDIKRVLERLLLKGSIVVKKAYCDWERYKSFKAAMHEANFELIEIPHVRQSGKNSADIRLVVDALDLCYTKSHVDTFVIISGDSDFSPLVSKLRENAKQVIGVGVKQSTSDLLIANCDEFIFYDDLVRDSQRAAAKREARDNVPAARRSPEEEARRKEELEGRRRQAIDIAVETFEALLAERGESGKIWASMLKEAIKRRKPDFNESYFGFRAFGNLLEEAQTRGLLELGRDEKSGTYVARPSHGGSAASEHPLAFAALEPVVVEQAAAGAAEPAAVAEPAARPAKTQGRSSRRRGGGKAAGESERAAETAPEPPLHGGEERRETAEAAALAAASEAGAGGEGAAPAQGQPRADKGKPKRARARSESTPPPLEEGQKTDSRRGSAKGKTAKAAAAPKAARARAESAPGAGTAERSGIDRDRPAVESAPRDSAPPEPAAEPPAPAKAPPRARRPRKSKEESAG
ncbi:NYN domain-containing protein [Thauera chlorobenzoica]|uniref:Maebl n=1 Tax=Thauera chlorobenzoica TaxID=96773 RepID=A0A1H5VGP3_9RHOO|nr:NYN domain-containing protein [Thauera chlorobenzoica]APR05798.1 Maebl [Thauera chlorobenzoica]SEF86535.1 TIGR00288 family protein [Thauera chlorobenzoica]